MEYPKELRFKVNNIFGSEDITIWIVIVFLLSGAS